MLLISPSIIWCEKPRPKKAKNRLSYLGDGKVRPMTAKFRNHLAQSKLRVSESSIPYRNDVSGIQILLSLGVKIIYCAACILVPN